MNKKSLPFKLFLSLVLLGMFLINTNAQLQSENNSQVQIKVAQAEDQNTSFMVLSDLHYFASELIINEGTALDNYVAQDRKMILESSDIMRAAADKVLELKPDYLLIPGDLTKDGAQVSHTNLAAFFKEIEAAGTQVLVVPGNHDINNPDAASFDGDVTTAVDYTTPDQFQSIYADYGYSDAEVKDENSLSYVEKFSDDSPFWVLALDVCHYDDNVADGSPETAGSIKEETLEWVKEILNDANEKGVEVLTMMHHGMLEHYTNHATVFPDYVIEDWEEISEQLANLGLSIVFTGHGHAQDITRKITTEGNVIYDIETGSIVTYPCPYRWCDYNSDGTFVVDGGRIETVENIDGDFQEYAYNYLYSGLENLVSYTLVNSLGVPSAYASSLKEPIVNALIAHYAGDEQSPEAEDQSEINNAIWILKLTGEVETANYIEELYESIWTDLEPADWNITIDLNEKYAEQCDLTIFHNNNAASQLLGTTVDDVLYGSAAGFKATLDSLRNYLTNESILLSSGDNFLAGAQFQAGLDNSEGTYDAIAMSAMDYDAIGLGNHDFDFGTSVLAQFITDVDDDVPFLSCNLTFENESALQTLADEDRIAAYTVVKCNDASVGFIGATTPELDYLSSPGNTTIIDDVKTQVQNAVDELTSDGVNRIVFISHMQSISEDLALAAELTGVDIIIAGGGEELLGEEGLEVFPGDDVDGFYGTYPLVTSDKDNNPVYVVTTPGEYKYVGMLAVNFDDNGVITEISEDSRLYVVKEDIYGSDDDLIENIQNPVSQMLDEYASTIIADTQVELDGLSADIRTEETNLGNLVADAILWQANESSDIDVDVAFFTGGNINNDNVIPVGSISQLDTYDILPFPYFVSIVENVSPQVLKEGLENSVSKVEEVSERFLQISGIQIVWNDEGDALEYDTDGNIVDGKSGNRIVSATLDDGTVIIDEGEIVEDAPSINMAITDFCARGGDEFTFAESTGFSTIAGVTSQNALLNYLSAGLSNNLVTTDDYPEGGEGRIILLDTYTTIDSLNISDEVLLYPNPTDGCVKVYVNETGIFTLTDTRGVKVFEYVIHEGYNTISFYDIPSGAYIYGIYTQTNSNKGMIIKE